MTKEKIRISAALFALFITTAVGVTYTYAHDREGRMFDEAKHEAVKDAIASDDFTAFTEAVGEGAHILDVITEDNFHAFVEAKKLVAEGDVEGAKTIFDELGMKPPFGLKKSFSPLHNPEQHAAMHTAIETEDYTAFVQAVGEEAPILEVITEENFPKFVEIHELRQSGDFEGAKKLAEELGLPEKQKHYKRFIR